MVGLEIRGVCPYCKKEEIYHLGCATEYYIVNNSKEKYTKLRCHSCFKKYWCNHDDENNTISKKTHIFDKKKLTSVVCW